MLDNPEAQGLSFVQPAHVDVFKVADLLIAHALEHHPAAIDLVGYYGSYAQGVARPTSDLDIFYVPSEGTNPPVGRTVLVAGVLFDFWGISWNTLADFATGQKRGWAFAPAIVHHAQLLYTRTPDQATRFRQLQQQVLDLQTQQARPQMIQQALDSFQLVLAHLGNLRLATASGDRSNIRHAGWKVILAIIECLALANQTFFDRGIGSLLRQLTRLSAQPPDLAALLTTISSAEDPAEIASAAEKLALATRHLLRTLQTITPAQQTASELFAQSYPEIKDGLGKVQAACERQDPVAASATAWFAQYDLSLMLNRLDHAGDPANFNLYTEFASGYRSLELPDLLQSPLTDLPALAAQTQLLDEKLRHWLGAQGVNLGEFETVEDFARSL